MPLPNPNAPTWPVRRARKPMFLWMFRALAILIALSMDAIAPPLVQAAPRIKDLVEIEGVRGNDLVGYGLVVGLNGTGDGIRNSPFTEEALANLLERLGVNVTGEAFRPKNVAAVIITATLPPFSRIGGRIDITGNAPHDFHRR